MRPPRSACKPYAEVAAAGLARAFTLILVQSVLRLFPAPASVAALHVFATAAGLYALAARYPAPPQAGAAVLRGLASGLVPGALAAVQALALVAAMERGSLLFVAPWMSLAGSALVAWTQGKRAGLQKRQAAGVGIAAAGIVLHVIAGSHPRAACAVWLVLWTACEAARVTGWPGRGRPGAVPALPGTAGSFDLDAQADPPGTELRHQCLALLGLGVLALARDRQVLVANQLTLMESAKLAASGAMASGLATLELLAGPGRTGPRTAVLLAGPAMLAWEAWHQRPDKSLTRVAFAAEMAAVCLMQGSPLA